MTLVTQEGSMFITKFLQNYVVHCYHMYLINPGLDRIEELFIQHLYCPGIIHSIRK